jgi:hypothetical protein
MGQAGSLQLGDDVLGGPMKWLRGAHPMLLREHLDVPLGAIAIDLAREC